MAEQEQELLSLREIAAISRVPPDELMERLPPPSLVSMIGDDAVCVWTRSQVYAVLDEMGLTPSDLLRSLPPDLSTLSQDRSNLRREVCDLSEQIECDRGTLRTLKTQIKEAESRLRDVDRTRQSRETRDASIARGAPAFWPWGPPMTPPKRLQGVYRLLKDGNTIYIGQSVNIMARIADHMEDKDFDQFSYALVDGGGETLNEVESALIIVERPPRNHTARGKLFHPTGHKWTREDAQAVLDNYRSRAAANDEKSAA